MRLGRRSQLFDLQGDRGQGLADLIVKLLGGPQAFGFLCAESGAGTLATLVREPLQHRVEGLDEGGDLGAAARRFNAPLLGLS